MNRKSLGAWVMVGGLVVGLLILIYFSLQGLGIPILVLVVPAGILTLGFFVAFTPFLAVMNLDDEVKNAHALLADDMDDIRHGRITLTWANTGMAVICLGTELFLLDYFQKWNANWGGINVFLLGMIIVVITGYIGLRSDWFQVRRYRSQQRTFMVLLIGFVLCTVLGVTFTEPAGYSGMTRVEQAELVSSAQYFSANRAIDIAFFPGVNSGFNLNCDGDECLFLLAVIVVVICVAASAFIPHFWVIATMLMATLLCLFALRELLYSEIHLPSLAKRHKRHTG